MFAMLITNTERMVCETEAVSSLKSLERVLRVRGVLEFSADYTCHCETLRVAEAC